jgi:hypothetical protein
MSLLKKPLNTKDTKDTKVRALHLLCAVYFVHFVFKDLIAVESLMQEVYRKSMRFDTLSELPYEL